MKTAIIVLNRNQPQMTDRLCDHLKAHTHASYQLFVIEAGSDQDKLSHHTTHWINDPQTIKEGLRPARGFNRGIAIARQAGAFDAYWCLMNDMNFLEEDTLSLLLKDIARYPMIGLIQPRLLYSQWANTRVPGDKFSAPPGHIRFVPYMPHFCYLVTVPLLDALGEVYDSDNFYSHGGDIEMCWRAWAAGFAVAISGSCSVWEYVGGTYQGGAANSAHQYFMNEAQTTMLAWLKRKYGFQSKYEMEAAARRAMWRCLALRPQLWRAIIR